jgi:hypothetical protein
MNLLQTGSSVGENAYWVFMSFLYAWIAADIAEKFAKVSENWSDLKKREAIVPIYSHLVLAAFVVGTSWLGLTRALKNPKEVCAPEWGIIAPISLLLIIDFWILAAYFSYVQVIHEARLRGSSCESENSSNQSSYWICYFLVLYCFWDFFVYYLFPHWPGPWRPACSSQSSLCARAWMSFLCAGLAYVSLRVLNHVRTDFPVCVLSDGSLIALLVFYRALKQLSDPDASLQQTCIRVAGIAFLFFVGLTVAARLLDMHERRFSSPPAG